MINLLKKSLSSIEITKKSDIIDNLDNISQISSEANELPSLVSDTSKYDERIEYLREKFTELIRSTIDLLFKEGYEQSLVQCHHTFQTLQNEIKDRPIDNRILQIIIEHIESSVFPEVDIAAEMQTIQAKRAKNSIINSSDKVLGEDHKSKYRQEFVGLYFAVKNIVQREIDYVDKDIDVASFFDKER